MHAELFSAPFFVRRLKDGNVTLDHTGRSHGVTFSTVNPLARPREDVHEGQAALWPSDKLSRRSVVAGETATPIIHGELHHAWINFF